MTASAEASGRGGLWRLLTGLGLFLAFLSRVLVVLFYLGVLVGLWLLFTGGPPPAVPNRAVLVWAPKGALTEQPDNGNTPLLARSFLGGKPDQTRVADLITVLDRAAGDDRIKLAVLKLDDMGHAGLAQLQELAAVIRRFESSGKPVIAASYRYDQAQYFLAAQAQKVYLDPMGDVLLKGFGVYRYYFEDILNELGTQAHVFRVGKYKSAVKPFLRTDMSPAAREENRILLATLWDTYKHEVAAGRHVQPELIDQFIGEFADRLIAEQGDAAQAALKAGLMDKLATAKELPRELAALIGSARGTGFYRQIGDRDYLAATTSN